MNANETKIIEEIMELKWRILYVKEGGTVIGGMKPFDRKKAEARIKQLEKQLSS